MSGTTNVKDTVKDGALIMSCPSPDGDGTNLLQGAAFDIGELMSFFREFEVELADFALDRVVKWEDVRNRLRCFFPEALSDLLRLWHLSRRAGQR